MKCCHTLSRAKSANHHACGTNKIGGFVDVLYEKAMDNVLSIAFCYIGSSMAEGRCNYLYLRFLLFYFHKSFN